MNAYRSLDAIENNVPTYKDPGFSKNHPKLNKMKTVANKVKLFAKWTLTVNILGSGATLGFNILGAVTTNVVLSAITIAAIAGCAAFVFFVVLPMLKDLAQLASLAGGVSLPALSLI